MRIEAMSDDDWPEVRQIYMEGLETGDASFETEAPTWERWNTGHRLDCRLVARDEDELLGWAALSPISSRRVYAGVAEVSIYIAAAARGRGVGKALLDALITESEHAGVWTLQASIFPENEASVRLHKQGGFREVGRREAIAQRSGIWRDTLLLERRSMVAGN